MGYQIGTGLFTYGGAVSAEATSGYPLGLNAVIVKYNSAGVAQWAHTVTGGSLASHFRGVALSPDEAYVYAVGGQMHAGTFDYGNGVTVQGTTNGSTEYNPVIVKYDSTGVAQWGRTITSGNAHTEFMGVAVSPDGSVYAVGHQQSNNPVDYGNGDLKAGVGDYRADNAVIVKYDDTGKTLWAQIAKQGTSSQLGSWFYGVAADGSGVYAVGYQGTNGIYDYSGVTAKGYYPIEFNSVIVKYNSAGAGQWAKSTSGSGTGNSYFYGVATDGAGNVYAVVVGYK